MILLGEFTCGANQKHNARPIFTGNQFMLYLWFHEVAQNYYILYSTRKTDLSFVYNHWMSFCMGGHKVQPWLAKAFAQNCRCLHVIYGIVSFDYPIFWQCMIFFILCELFFQFCNDGWPHFANHLFAKNDNCDEQKKGLYLV